MGEVGSGLSSGSAYSLRPVGAGGHVQVCCARCGGRKGAGEAREKGSDGREQVVQSAVLTTVGSVDVDGGGLDPGALSDGQRVPSVPEEGRGRAGDHEV